MAISTWTWISGTRMYEDDEGDDDRWLIYWLTWPAKEVMFLPSCICL